MNDTAIDTIKAMNIYQRVHAIMSEMGTITKNGVNSFHNYNYAREVDYVEALRPLLIKYRVVMIPILGNVPKQEGDITQMIMKYQFVNIDVPTELIETVVPSAGQDKGDKGAYKAITGAKKYTIANLFVVATDDDPEKDDGRTEVKSKKGKAPLKAAVGTSQQTSDDF